MLGLSNRSIELVQPTNKTGLSQMTGFILRLKATQNNRISEFLFWDTWAWRVVAPIDSDLINNHRRYMERNHRVAQTNPLEEDASVRCRRSYEEAGKGKDAENSELRT